MAAPTEMIKGGERQTVYSAAKLALAEADGWQRVRDLTPEKQAELAGRPPLPWKGYEDQTYQEVLAQAAGLPPERIQGIVAYESATKGRVSIIGKLAGNASVQTPAVTGATTPALSAEQQLEAETGHDVVQTGTTPPTFVETDKPAPSVRAT